MIVDGTDLAVLQTVEEVRLVLLATLIGGTTAGTLYAGVHLEQRRPRPVTVASEQPLGIEIDAEGGESPEAGRSTETDPAAVPQAADLPELEELERLEEEEWREWLASADVAASNREELLLGGGVRLGPLDLLDPEREAEARSAARRRARPRVPPGPRLHPDPGQHTILVARQMIASGEAIQGSCYRYLSEVYARAGHSSWRKRTIVHRGERDGPYADLDLIRPGDWLYIVNDPHRSPVGTHSVMFLGWEDRARGYARTISHAGWGSPRPGRIRGYDVSRTYRIIRPSS